MIRSTAVALMAAALLMEGCAPKQKPSAPPIPVMIGEAVSMDVPVELREIGSVEPFIAVSITARVTGQLLHVHFHEGQDVAKGTVLFQIDPAPSRAALAQARANLNRDNVTLANAQADVARYKDLVEKDYVTRQQWDAVVATAGEARATVRADSALVNSARLNLDYCTIRAPISGRTGTVLVQEGNIVVADAPTPLVVINQISPVYVSFAVPEQQLPEIRSRARDATLDVWVEVPPDSMKISDGRLTFIDNMVDQTTGTILLKATFPNDSLVLWPGQFVQVGLVLGKHLSATVVPSAAVQVSQQGDYLYAVMTGDTVQMRHVTKGTVYQDLVIIENGVAPGERVVTDGQLQLVPGARVMIRTGLTPATSKRPAKS